MLYFWSKVKAVQISLVLYCVPVFISKLKFVFIILMMQFPLILQATQFNNEPSSIMDFEDTVPAEMRTESDSSEKEAKVGEITLYRVPLLEFHKVTIY